MDFNEYQSKASVTIQNYNTTEDIKGIIPFLGIIGETGSVISELKKKLRDGDNYTNFNVKLKQELGDVLWYISAIATMNKLSLEEIASDNLFKIQDRFSEEDKDSYKNFDEGYPTHESLPDEFEVIFKTTQDQGRYITEIIHKETGAQIGDPLTDNNYDNDGYRYHDIFHFGYLACMGWSPVLRQLLKCKRKSKPEIDENEDGARARIAEELISLLVYTHATNHLLLKYSKNVDTELLHMVRDIVKNLEVKVCSAKQWENTILNSFEVFNKLIDNEGGRVLVSKKNRMLTYVGKK